MTIDFITKNDLLELKKEIISEVSNLLTGSHENKKWLKSADVRKMLSISPGTLQHLRVSRILPYNKIGGTVFYDYNEVIKVMQKNKSEAV